MTRVSFSHVSKKKLWLAGAVLVVAGVCAKLFIFRTPFLYAGTLEATKVDLSARLAAAIESITVEEGDRVTKEESLVTLACEDFKIDAHHAHENYDRYTKILKQGFTTQEAIDQYKTAMEDADTRVTWCTLKSPIDGKVLSRYHEPGEWMSPGTKILTIANIQDIWTYIYVPQPKIAQLSLGMQLKAYLPELNQRVFTGTVVRINDEAEFTPKNVQTRYERERLVFGVKISFLTSNAEEILKPGMTVEVELPE